MKVCEYCKTEETGSRCQEESSSVKVEPVEENNSDCDNEEVGNKNIPCANLLDNFNFGNEHIFFQTNNVYLIKITSALAHNVITISPLSDFKTF